MAPTVLPNPWDADFILQQYECVSKWFILEKQLKVRVCKIPNTDAFLYASANIMALAGASWHFVEDESLRALHECLTQELTRRRGAASVTPETRE